MNKTEILKLLQSLEKGESSQDEVAELLSGLGMDSLGYAVIDTDRSNRTGIPEVIYSAGKTPLQVAEISARMNERGIPVLATRAEPDVFEAVKEKIPGAIYHEMAKAIVYQPVKPEISEGYIAMVSAGTSDMPVSEEAALTAEFLGNRVERIYDVGVAGIHRLFNRIDLIRGASVVIVAAGMEGALASVIGGMVDKPVIGIPCSTGYGANFGGVSALLSMLNSCAAGVSVVNIDNGFGAACQAHLINKSIK
ncbi:MAG: nickel pincer cofactor biosynthesis protein LarB [Bacteroides sp.]|nr:nickel pincer cofactor biosynthesis protein LarB [Bacteroides sp.]